MARQVARGMLHSAMSLKCAAAFQQSLRKVEPDSTSCNASGKNVARVYNCDFARYVTPCNFACYLCGNKIARQVAWCNCALR